MGLELIKNPGDFPDAGIFNLPPGFPVHELASEWVAKDQVPFKQQRQNLIGTGYSADGWTIWKSETGGKPLEVVTGKGVKFVLMVRARALQNEINALYGNVSKQRINREVKGETVAGTQQQDGGILTEKQLRDNQVGGHSDESSLDLNRIRQPEVAST